MAAADPVLLRAAVLPEIRKTQTWVDMDPEDVDADRLAGYVRDLTADPLVTEAITVSSPSLGQVLRKVLAGSQVTPAQLRRSVAALTRYLLRMTSRPTPFGLLAGVAIANVDSHAAVTFGTGHSKGVRPDMGWLMDLVTRWERTPETARALRVVVNPLCVVRGERLVLGYDSTASEKKAASEVSARYGPAVRSAVEYSGRPVPFEELVGHLLAEFPNTASADSVRSMLCTLIERELLLTDLRPPPEEADPLRYVSERLSTLTHLPEVAALWRVSELMREYAQAPVGAGLTVWGELSEAMRALHHADNVVQVDLRLDVQACLPRVVLDEVEQAAAALWRAGPPHRGIGALRQYHADFMERYGTGRLVDFQELLDPDRGLGAPATYRMPASERELRHEPAGDAARDELLISIAQDALLDGGEVVLDEPLLERLGGAEPPPPPSSAELFVQLLADSTAAVQAGDFRLALSTIASNSPAGPTFGRFAYLLSDSGARVIAMAQAATADATALPAQLAFAPVPRRLGNVIQVPRMLPLRLPVGVFPDHDDASLHPADLLVGADHDGLYLVSRSLGREIVPTSFNMANTGVLATNMVRFLDEVGIVRRGGIPGWTWGGAERLPYLPRVRYRRTILSPARWKPTPDLTEPKLSWSDWRQRWEAWRKRWRVPGLVYMTSGDHRIELNLDVPLHLRMLWQELRRTPSILLHEPPGGAQLSAGWLGGHVHELVVPLLSRRPEPKRVVPRIPAPARQPARRHLPGGEWLYLKLYASAARHDELLADHLPALLTDLPESVDRWFFLRYRDPDPHLRLRFHAADRGQLAGWLNRAHDWASGLADAGLAYRLACETYEPETGRYGGPDLLESAEYTFCADSAAAIDQVRLCRAGRLDIPTEVLLAAGYVDLLRRLGDDDWTGWLLSHHPRGADPKAWRRHRDLALRVVDPAGNWAGLRGIAGGDELLASWDRYAGPLADYGELLRKVGRNEQLWSSRDSILDSLLHMRHNRCRGIDRDTERRSLAIAREVVQVYLDRLRHAS